MGHVIDDIKKEIQEFENKLITFVKRDDNWVAHLLVKYAAKVVLNNIYHVTPLDCICDMLLLKQFAPVSWLFNEIYYICKKKKKKYFFKYF